ncbi:MAG: selenocysteine-specific translation elongation factor [Phycisphaerae bacterium]|nr:selenocysteine-specific translation elongation factor [Phycisphaerae bacterium]
MNHSSPASPRLIIGTAGHIDHGKSSLVRALTGIDPDRLPEERARGMTIDLGFAHAREAGASLYFVDVPGHERFIRNMVAGAVGIDLALLIVAANEGLMPQTREHAHLLALLNVSRCIVVITKSDLAPPDLVEFVRDEAVALLRSLAIDPIAAVATSATSGAGVAELRALLATLATAEAKAAADRSAYRWFRMPIDRAFSISGRGTVVTGTVWHGDVGVGDELQLLPDVRTVRVREIQTHQSELDRSSGRRRLAINLPGIEVAEAGRGCELATPGYLQARSELLVRLVDLLVLGRKPVSRLRVRLHLATTECLAELHLASPLSPGRHADIAARVRVGAPIVAAYGQRFVIRTESATKTLGGGQVLHPAPRRARARNSEDWPAALGAAEISIRLLAALRMAPWQPIAPSELSTICGSADALATESILHDLESTGDIVRLHAAAQTLVVPTSALRELTTAVIRRVERFAADHPRSGGAPVADLAKWLPPLCPPRFHAELIQRLLASGSLSEQGGRVLPTGAAAGPALPPADLELYQSLLQLYESAALAPPGFAALPMRTEKNAQRLYELTQLAVTRGDLLLLDGELAPPPRGRATVQTRGDAPIGALLLHRRAWDSAVAAIRGAIQQRGPLLISEIRDVLSSSRKVVVPLMERLDAAKITIRAGDRRALG